MFIGKCLDKIAGRKNFTRVSPLHCHSTKDIEDFLRVTADIAATVKA